MTKTEAAQIIALMARVAARKNGRTYVTEISIDVWRSWFTDKHPGQPVPAKRTIRNEINRQYKELLG